MKINTLIKIFTITVFVIASSLIQAVAADFTPSQKRSLYNSDTREVIDLGSGWEMSMDGKNWQTVDLPYTSLSGEPIYFEKTIKLKKSALKQYVWGLHFLGATEDVEISVNGNFIEKFFSGGGPFSLTVPEKYLDKEVNTFRLKVYPVTKKTKLAMGSNIYAPEIYTGMERNIFLVGTPKIWISDFTYSADFSPNYSAAKVSLNVSISSKKGDYLTELREMQNTSAIANDSVSPSEGDSLPANTRSATEIYLRAKLLDKNGGTVSESESVKVTIDPDRTIGQNTTLELSNPELWYPKQPNLYTVSLELSASPNGDPIDNIRQKIGFKDLAIEGNSFVLNGQPFMPKGVNYTLPFGTDSISLPTLLENDVNMLKSLGANLILFNKTSPHPYLSSLCDRFGLLMMVDLPADGVPSSMLTEDNFRVRTENIAERFVSSLKNNVSLMAIGVHGNISKDKGAVEFSKYFGDKLKSISDFNTYATTSGNGYVPEDVDFVVQRIPSSLRDFDKVEQAIGNMVNRIGKPLLVRYGVAVKTQHLYGWEDQQSEEYQGHYLKNVYSILQNYDGTGSIVDYYRDYKLSNPLLTVDKDNLYMATGGLISDEGKEKVSYRVMKAFYNDERQPLISAGEPKSDSPIVFTIISIVLIIAVLLMLNRYRRFREYFLRSIVRPYNFYSDIRDQRIMSTARTFIIGFIVASSMALFISALIYNFRTTETLQTILMLMLPFQAVLDFVVRISWQPLMMFLFFTSAFFLLMFVISFILRFFGVFSRHRLSFADTLTVTIWSAVPFLVMLPVTMVIPKLLAINELMVIGTVVFGLFLGLWIFLRILNASSVVMDKALPTVYIIGLGFLVFLILTPIIFYNVNYAFLDYVGYFFDSQST